MDSNERSIEMGRNHPATYDRRLNDILSRAAAVFCARGYHRASMRDVARSTGVSLAGLYYYFSSKEHLLFLIQRHTFDLVLASSRAALDGLREPEERLRAFVRLHIQFFLNHPNEMKVLVHEAGSLPENWRGQVNAIKKVHYRLCFDQVRALKEAHKLEALNVRVAVLALFGMMNWIYTWYDPKADPDAGEIAEQMVNIFLSGIRGSMTAKARARNGRPAGRDIEVRLRLRPATPSPGPAKRDRPLPQLGRGKQGSLNFLTKP
jgi:AcrR family transcriptional regulator